MKKILSFALALVMLLSLSLSLGMAESAYTLEEKIHRQVAIGSGFRGSMTLQVDGVSELAEKLGIISGIPLELRAIRSGYDFQTDVYALANDIEYGRTKFFGNDLEVALVSDLMPGEKVSFPIDSTLLNILFPRAENPSILSAVESLLSLTSDEQTLWAETFAPYTQEVERWLNAYASTPDLSENEDGEKVMTISYEIPFSAVSAEILTLITKLAADTEARALLETKLTPEQMTLYVNPNLAYFYDAAVNGLNLEGSVSLTREMTTQGKVLTTSMNFPLAENRWGYTLLSVTDDGQTLNLELTGEASTLFVSLLTRTVTRDHVALDAIVRLLQLEEGEDKSVSARVNYVMRRNASVDAEGKTQEQVDISFHAASDLSHLAEDDPEREKYDQFVDMVGYAAIKMNSKNSNLSPTYADVEAGWTSDGLSISATGSFRTSSAWVMDGLTTGDGQLYGALTEEAQHALIDTFLEKLKEMATTVRVVLGLEEAPATPTDVTDSDADAAAADDSTAEGEETAAADDVTPAATATPTVSPAATEAPTQSPALEDIPLP